MVAIIAAANEIVGKPYDYGGGHGSWEDSGYDCSGSESYALHGAGLVSRPMNSSEFMSWGEAGPGAWITSYANSGHSYLVVAGLRFDTGFNNAGSGPRWSDEMRPADGYTVRHCDRAVAGARRPTAASPAAAAGSRTTGRCGAVRQTPATMPYTLTSEQVDFRDTIRQIVRERVAPRAAEIDAKAEYPWDLRRLFAEQDLLGLPFDEVHGGTGTGTLMLNVAVEEIARACASSALILMIQELGTLPIKLFGTRGAQAALPARSARSGEWSPAFALSEPEAGSDPGGMITRAVRDGDEWVVTGTKNWITNLGVADFYVVFAKTDTSASRSRGISAFVVEADRPGFSVGKLEHKLGIKGSPTGQPIFDDVRIPAANLIGEEGKGMNVALGTLDHSRLGVAAQAVGIAQGATDHAVAYANERRQFGQPISEFQGIQFKLADMETRTAAARELLYRACAKIDRHEPDRGKYSAMAKLFASDTAMAVTVEAVQVLRRLRLRHRVPGRALHARRQDHADLRGHERDPAARDRARAPIASVHARALADRTADRLRHGAVPRGRADRRRAPAGAVAVRAAARCSRCSRSSWSARRSPR